MRRTETPKPIWIKFCMVVDIADVVTYTNIGDHRLRGFCVAGGQISPSPIYFHRRPYNILALPCERVIGLVLGMVLGSLVSASDSRNLPFVTSLGLVSDLGLGLWQHNAACHWRNSTTWQFTCTVHRVRYVTNDTCLWRRNSTMQLPRQLKILFHGLPTL